MVVVAGGGGEENVSSLLLLLPLLIPLISAPKCGGRSRRQRRKESERKSKKREKREREKRLAFLLVLDGDLGLAVGPQPRDRAVLADLGELVAELRGEDVGQGHELRGLVGGVAFFFFFFFFFSFFFWKKLR